MIHLGEISEPRMCGGAVAIDLGVARHAGQSSVIMSND